MNLKWQRKVHELAKSKGWHTPMESLTEDQRSAIYILAEHALSHLNISYVVEAARGGNKHFVGPPEFMWERFAHRLSWVQIQDLAAMALIHSEVSEAVECILEGDYLIRTDDWGKPEGAVVELADVVIRILDWCQKKSLYLKAAVKRKHEYNKTRPRRHGDKLA